MTVRYFCVAARMLSRRGRWSWGIDQGRRSGPLHTWFFRWILSFWNSSNYAKFSPLNSWRIWLDRYWKSGLSIPWCHFAKWSGFVKTAIAQNSSSKCCLGCRSYILVSRKKWSERTWWSRNGVSLWRKVCQHLSYFCLSLVFLFAIWPNSIGKRRLSSDRCPRFVAKSRKLTIDWHMFQVTRTYLTRAKPHLSTSQA